jgi:ribosomal protein L32
MAVPKKKRSKAKNKNRKSVIILKKALLSFNKAFLIKNYKNNKNNINI